MKPTSRQEHTNNKLLFIFGDSLNEQSGFLIDEVLNYTT
jgi:hypothetical protein